MNSADILREARLACGLAITAGLVMALSAAGLPAAQASRVNTTGLPAAQAGRVNTTEPSAAQARGVNAAGLPAAQAGRGNTTGLAAAQARGADAAGLSICQSARHPVVAARLSSAILATLSGRFSAVGLTVDDRVTGITCKLHPHWHIDSASVVKVTILSALLRKLQEQHRSLTVHQQQLATAMITVSDNNAASALWAQTGHPSLQRFLNLAGMRETQLGPGGFWGLTQITAHDELTLLRLLTSKNTVLSAASCRYVLNLMAHVTPSQRWGVPAGAPTSVTVHVKNGWLPQPTHGWRINSIGSFSGHGRDYMIVVLTWNNPTMTYGVNTVQAVAEVINRALNPGTTSVIAPTRPYPSWGTPDEQIPPPSERS